MTLSASVPSRHLSENGGTKLMICFRETQIFQTGSPEDVVRNKAIRNACTDQEI